MKALLTLVLFLTTTAYLKAQWNPVFPTFDPNTTVGVDPWQTLWADQYGYLISGKGGIGTKIYGITLKSSDLLNWAYADTARNDNFFHSFVRFDTSNVIAVTPTKVKKSYQNGKNWIEKDTLPKNGSGGGYFNLLQINNTTALLSSTNSLYKTIDKGETWQKVTTTDRLGKLYQRGNIIYSLRKIGTTLTIATSTDNGNTWAHSPTIPMPVTGIHFQNKDTVFAYDEASWAPLYCSFDGGNSFDAQDTIRLSARSMDMVYFINNKIGFAHADNGSLYKTCDRGASWVENTNALYLENQNQFFFVNDTVGFALSRRFHPYGGFVTWNQGGICPLVGIANNVQEKENISIKVFPNPTSGNFTVSNESLKGMQLIIYDALGRILLSTYVEAGSTKDISLHLPSAIYFIKGDNGFYYKLLVKE